MEMTYAARRMLLRQETSRNDVLRYAAAMGWAKTGEEGALEQSQTYRLVFSVVPGTAVRYVEDFTSRQRYLYVSSNTDWVAERLATLIDDDLSPWPLSDLVAACDHSRDLEHGRALMRLGVAAPYEYNPEVFARLDAGMQHPDPRVRRLSLWATTYSPWPQYLARICAIAQADPEPALQERAETILAVLQRAAP
ncbi:hypothetical protein ABT299_25975 [Spirillospora sp. NPDC000708]